MSSRNSTRIHDSNTINAITNGLSKEEVIDFFEIKRKEIREKTGVDSNFKVNLITTLSGDKRVPTGFCFIYWEKNEAYHTLLGNNPDGTERYVYKPDPDWKEHEEKEVQEIHSWDDIISNPNNVSWANIISEGTSWADMTEVENKRLAPMIAEKLPPLIDDFKYVRANGEVVEILVQPFFITVDFETEKDLDTHKLFALVPNNVTENTLYTLFKPFSHRSEYPKIRIKKLDNNRNPAFIEFSSATNDARFAREIMMFTTIGDTLIKFNYPRSLPSNNNKHKHTSYKGKYTKK